MPESVRDLTVRLAFEHGDTKGQIAAIKNEIKLLETGFQAAALTAGGLSDSMNQAGAKSETLRRQIALQEQAVAKYGEAIKTAQEKIKTAQQRQQEYTAKLEDAKKKQAALTQEISRVKAAMNASRQATGENTEEYAQLSAELADLEQQLKENDNAVKTWERGLTRASTSINAADREVQRLTIAQNECRIAQGQMQRELDTLNNRVRGHVDELNRASTALNEYSERLRTSTEWQEKAGKTMSKASAAIVSAGVAAAGTAIQWESSMADVAKTVSGTKEQLDEIEAGLMSMSQTKPIDNTTLADIAANAGQLGIWTDNILQFTGVMADLANTTNLTAEEGASAFAQFANITGMAQTNFDRLGSVVVQLGNNMATTEKDIVNMATNLASAGSQIGMTEAEIMGVAATLSSLGLEAQAGGTAFSKLFVNMQVAAETGSDELAKFAGVAGMTAKEFKTLFQRDAAGAVTAFVSGLGSGSQSAIAILEEMGIKETRFRDALLRTSNASELFTSAIEMANGAWSENSALANEAAVRYGTTASKLTILGNKAKATAVSFGQSLIPIINEGLDWVSQLLEKFNAMDDGMRRQILTWGAYVAAAGPALTMIGKANKGIAAIAAGLGKFTGAMATAGGGLKGLMSAVGGLLGPAGIAALAVAAGVMIYKFADWASGAKAAREATEALNKTAKDWSETQAQTLYDTGNTDPLARFGLTKDAFKGSSTIDAAKTWIANLTKTWSDGEKETDEIVKEYVDSFTGLSDGVRQSIEDYEGFLGDYDALTPEAQRSMDADLKQLDQWDKEVAALLKKRQNGFLTEEEQARLQEIIDKRGEIEVKYSLNTDSGYEQILSQMEAAVERAEHGGRVDENLFGDTLNALAEGRKAYMDALDQSYNAEYAQIQLLQDEEARMNALDKLNQRYNEQRVEGEEAYADSVRAAATAAWKDNDEYAKQITKIDELAEKLGNGEALSLPEINKYIGTFDEGKLTSMIALVEQLKAAGLSDSEMADLGIDYDDILSKIEQIRNLAGSTEGLGGIADIFGKALPEEIQRIMVGLDMTQAAEDWAAFAEGESLTKIKAGVEVDSTKTIDLTGTVTDVNPAPGVTLETDVMGNVTTVVTKSGLRFNVDGDGRVTSVTTPTGETIDLTGNVTDIAPIAGVTFTADGTGKLTSVSADGVTFSGVKGSGEITLVTVSNEATIPTFSTTCTIKLNPLDQAAIDEWEKANSGKQVSGITAKVGVKLGSGWATEIKNAYDAGILEVWGADGAKIDVTPEVIGKITANDVAVYDTDGTLHVVITPEIGSPEAVSAAGEAMNQNPGENTWLAALTSSTKTDISNILNAYRQYSAANDAINSGNWDMTTLSERDEYLGQLATHLQSLSDMDLSNIATEAANLMKALDSGELSDEDAAAYTQRLQDIADLVSAADSFLGSGNNISAGIAKGMTDYDYTGDATTLATDLTSCINAALGAHSPATKLIPTGTYAAMGIAKGLVDYDYAPPASMVESKILGAFIEMRKNGTTIGQQFGAGLAAGLNARLPGIVNSAKAAAQQIVDAFRDAWQMHSPSKVAEGLTGMFGKGLEKGMDHWPTVSKRLLQDDLDTLYSGGRRASEVVEKTINNDNTSAVNLTGNNFYVRDDQDVRSLAVEIATLTKRQQRGKGLRAT